MSGRFLEASVRNFTSAMSHALLAERCAYTPGLMQSLDPRVRVLGVFVLVLAATLCHRLEIVAALLGVAILLAVSSGISLLTLARRVWLIVLGFTGLIALPALFTTSGEPWMSLPFLHLPISHQGLRTALLLILRVETAATLTTVLVLCTPWTHILKALRWMHVPAEIVAMLNMTHRYAFLVMETASQMFESRQSRMVGVLRGREQRQLTARTAGVLLSKSLELSQEVYLAMVSRGFRGEVRLLTDLRMRARDYWGISGFIGTGVLALWVGR